MKKVLITVLAFVILGIVNCVAQVAIGTLETPNASLDVRSQPTVTDSADGILAPKLTGIELAAKGISTYGAGQDGALVYVTSPFPSNPTGRNINLDKTGYYFYDALENVWVRIVEANLEPEWFYMPPSLIDTEPETGKLIDLFAAYSASVTSAIGSDSGISFSAVSPVGSASDYDYYVVGYDDTVFDNNIVIDTDGVMTYDIIGRATDKSYINIVFMRK